MKHNSTHTRWLRIGLLVAILIVTGSLPHAPAVIEAQGGGSISYGAKVFDTISEETPRVTYSFTGGAGDVVTVIADNWAGTLDLRAELIAPNGVSIGSSTQNTLDDNMQGAYLLAVLPDDGVYLLWITGENGTTGDFALTLLGHPAPDSIELIFGEAVDVTLTPGAEPQLFWFEAVDCPTTLVATNLSEGQPFTYPFVGKVYDQRGQTVALLRGGEELEDWVTVTPRSGRYEVEVSSDDLLEPGDIRLLVTCAADAPGCPPGQAGISGVAGSGAQECPPCFVPGDPLDSGGCPDLNFRAESFPVDDALRVTVTWDAMTGATGYSVTVYGRTTDGGDVYLTHSTWTPGDPTAFTWFLPRHYVGFRFLLRVAIDDDVVCAEETRIELETPPPPGDGLPACEDFAVTIATRTSTAVTFEWTYYPDAERYMLYILDDSDNMLPGYPALLAPTQHSVIVDWLEPGSYTFVVAPWFDPEGAICHAGLTFDIEEVPEQWVLMCWIRTDRPDVRARVGPGLGRSAFAFLTPGVDYPVIGQAMDAAGNLWWQIDKTLIPGHEVVISLWVQASDVEDFGDCGQVPPGDVPPVIPAEPDVPPGSWGPCGSCDTCGHPASECVLSPEGVCLWDPATCGVPSGGDCYTIRAAVDMTLCQGISGSAMIDTVPNCNGGYAPGTLIQAHAVAVDPKCNVNYWSGCGASGGENSVTFTATGSCTVTAHMHFGR